MNPIRAMKPGSDLYHKYRGQIDEQFGFLAFRTAPLVSSSTMDAKIATADMAQNLMLWAAIGKPNQREWVAGGRDRQGYEKNDGLFPSGYHLFRGEVSGGTRRRYSGERKNPPGGRQRGGPQECTRERKDVR